MTAEPALTRFELIAAGDTHIGRREHNEDAILLRPDLDLFVLADGAGGHSAGNVASAIATTTIAHYFEATQHDAALAPLFDELGLSSHSRRLSVAVHRANHEVVAISKTSDRHRGMGTTVVAGYFRRDSRTLHLAHVGDSRCYRLRAGTLEQLTDDHTLINDVLELRPDITPEHADQLPRYVITRALGMSESVRVTVRTHEVLPGDRYLMCSDGVSDALDDDSIASALQVEHDPEEIVRVIIELARSEGARDNLAAVVVTCGSWPTPLPSSRPPKKPRLKSLRESRSEGSDPEIVIVGLEQDDEGPPIHVVPPSSASLGMLTAVHGFVDASRVKKGDEDPRESTTLICTRCGKPSGEKGLVCQSCGMPRRL